VPISPLEQKKEKNKEVEARGAHLPTGGKIKITKMMYKQGVPISPLEQMKKKLFSFLE
jgi:hypothetical protein